MLGLGNNLKKQGLTTPGIITDSLVLKHKYDAGSVVPISDGVMYFDSSADSYVTVSDSSSLDFKDAFSSCFWIMPLNADSDWELLWGKGDLSDGVQVYKMVQINTNGIMRLELNEASASRADTTTSLQNNQWYHIACTYDKSNTKIYVNGVLEDTTSYSTSIVQNSEDLHIGLANVVTSGWEGYMCNLGMWNVALTQPQIKSIMNKRYTDLTSSELVGLTAWWAFDTDANDATDNNNDGVISGG